MPILSYARCSSVKASNRNSCWSFVPRQENVSGISTPCIISFLVSHLVRLQNVLDMTVEQTMKQTQLLLWHVKWRERPVLIFASKLSFMTGRRRKMCRTPSLFLVQIKVTQCINKSIWSCDSMRSKFLEFVSQDADSGTFFTSSVFT